ncbi:MAG: hypothetical protein ABIJ09_20995 [Pseudomonadota bacterium]
MRNPPPAVLGVVLLALSPGARAGYTETLPGGAAMLDVGYVMSSLDQRYDDTGQRVGLIDKLERYDPGGGLQGVLLASADVSYEIFAPQLRLGVFDMLTLAVAAPVVRRTRVTPHLGWQSGDYQWTLGRSFSEEDFWQWAASMGQPRPSVWEGNFYTLADIIVGGRYRFSDHLPWLGEHGLHFALQVMGALPTGTPKDPEELVASGTTSWELNFQGHLGVHLSVDKTFAHSLDGRLTLGLDVFHELFFAQQYNTPRGTKNPLILTVQPYAGDTYVVDPGDFTGFGASVEVVPVKGPTFATFVSGHSLERARALPPLLTLGMEYTFTFIGQSDWQSESALWDYTNEKQWKPGTKNALRAIAVLSFLRLGTPLQAYLSYKTLSLIPGRNSRATDVVTVGLRVPFVVW